MELLKLKSKTSSSLMQKNKLKKTTAKPDSKEVTSSRLNLLSSSLTHLKIGNSGLFTSSKKSNKNKLNRHLNSSVAELNATEAITDAPTTISTDVEEKETKAKFGNACLNLDTSTKSDQEPTIIQQKLVQELQETSPSVSTQDKDDSSNLQLQTLTSDNTVDADVCVDVATAECPSASVQKRKASENVNVNSARVNAMEDDKAVEQLRLFEAGAKNNGIEHSMQKQEQQIEMEIMDLDMLPSAPIKSDSETEDADEISKKFKPHHNLFVKNKYPIHDQDHVVINAALKSEAALAAMKAQLIVTNPEAKENVSPLPIQKQKENQITTENKPIQQSSLSSVVAPDGIIKIKPFKTSFSKTSAFSKIKNCTNQHKHHMQKPLKPLNNNAIILNSYAGNFSHERIPLKISWEQLTQDFDLDDIDDLDDDALTSIQYYNMILREDLLPQRYHQPAQTQDPHHETITILPESEKKKSELNSKSRSASRSSTLDGESNSIEFDPDKPLINISDSLANLCSGTSLINRTHTHIVPYTDDLNEDQVDRKSCPHVQQHHTLSGHTQSDSSANANTSSSIKSQQEDYYNDLYSVYYSPTNHLTWPNSSSNCSNYYECTNYNSCCGQTGHNHNPSHYCRNHSHAHTFHHPYQQYQKKGHCGFLQVQHVQPTLANNTVNCASDTSKQKQGKSVKLKATTTNIKSNSDGIDHNPSASGNGNSTLNPASKFENVFAKTRKAFGRAKTVLTSTFSFGGFGHSSRGRGVNYPHANDGGTLEINHKSCKTGKCGIRTKGTVQMRKDGSPLLAIMPGKCDNGKDSQVITKDSHNNNDNGIVHDNLSSCTLYPPGFKINPVTHPAIMAPGTSLAPDPGSGASLRNANLNLESNAVDGSRMNQAKNQQWPKSSCVLDSVHNFDYFYQHYLKEENKKLAL